MTELLPFDAYRFAVAMAWLGTLLVVVNLVAVVSERTAFALGKFGRRLLERRYQPIAERAMLGDPAARHRLVVSARRHRFYIARLLHRALPSDADAPQPRALVPDWDRPPRLDDCPRS